MKKIIAMFLSLTLLVPAVSSAEETKETPPVSISSPSAILINAENGDILFEKEKNKTYDIASVTKVMTLLIASEELKKGTLKPTDNVKVSEKAWRMGGSKMFIEVGQDVPVEEIIKGIAVVSGNDASVALAEHIGDTEDQFVDLMNKKAKKLKMNDTVFYSPNGLGLGDNKHFDTSTVKDLALLAKHYVNAFPENMNIHGMTEYTTKTRTHDIPQKNANGLLTSYKGATGLKTGMINGNYNVIATAQRDETKLIAIILGAKSANMRENDAAALLNYGFTQYKTITKGTKNEVVGHIPVYKSASVNQTDLILADDLAFIVHIDDEAKITLTDEFPDYLKGGTKAGEVVGKRIVEVNDKTYEADITVAKDIDKAGFVKSFFDSIAMFFQWMVGMVFD